MNYKIISNLKKHLKKNLRVVTNFTSISYNDSDHQKISMTMDEKMNDIKLSYYFHLKLDHISMTNGDTPVKIALCLEVID